jgi:hypothetical protein
MFAQIAVGNMGVFSHHTRYAAMFQTGWWVAMHGNAQRHMLLLTKQACPN